MMTTRSESKVKQMERFHLLVDLELQGNLGAVAQAELVTLRKKFDRREAPATARLLKQMTKKQTNFDKSMARIRSQVAALRVDLANAPNHPKSRSASAS
jgi:hypothetical protein